MGKKNFQEQREREREQRKRIIAQNAASLLDKKGLEAVTMRDVAKNAGVSVGSIYQYFKNKEDVFVFLLIDQIRDLAVSLKKSMRKKKPELLFAAMAHDYRRYYLAYGRYVDALQYVTGFEASKRSVDPKLLDELRQQLDATFSELEKVFQRPAMAPWLKGVAPQRAVPVFWSLVAGLSQVTLHTARASETGFGFEEVLQDVIQMVKPE